MAVPVTPATDPTDSSKSSPGAATQSENAVETSSEVETHAAESSEATVRPEQTVAAVSEPKAGSEKDKDGPNSKTGEKTANGSQATMLKTVHSRQKIVSSEKAKPNGSSEPQGSASPPTSKPSIFSRIVHILLPCIPSAAQVQDIAPPPPKPDSKEKQPAKDPEKVVSEPPPPPKDQPSEPLSLTTQIPPDPNVILPPTPTTPQKLPVAETEGMTSGAVVPPGSTGVNHSPTHSRHSNVPSTADESDGTSFTEEEELDDVNNLDEVEDEEDRLIMNGGAGIPIGPDGVPKPLLPPIAPHHAGRKCLVLDLDETLVHSSFKSIAQADYVVPVEIEYHWHNVYVIKRPGVDNFLKKMGEIYEIVVFTASLSKYADPVLDKLDIHQVVTHRLFRESCYNHKGNYVKDLSQLGRPIADTIILDNSPASYIFHPNNAVPVSSWFNDPHDTELTDLVPFLADLSAVDDVRGVLDGGR